MHSECMVLDDIHCGVSGTNAIRTCSTNDEELHNEEMFNTECVVKPCTANNIIVVL